MRGKESRFLSADDVLASREEKRAGQRHPLMGDNVVKEGPKDREAVEEGRTEHRRRPLPNPSMVLPI